MSLNPKNLKPINKGIFITFEGCEGTGKSTQSRLLYEYCKSKDIDSIITREPGGTASAEKLRNLLLDKEVKMEISTQLMLHFASRIEHVNDIILPALLNKKVVICDRFFDSTIAYQHYGHGVNKNIIEQIHKEFLNNLMPDITFLLNLSLERYIEKNLDRFDKADRYENLDMSYHLKVLSGFDKLAKLNPARIKLINISDDLNETQTMIRSIFDQII